MASNAVRENVTHSGSANSPVVHWWYQRLTAAALVPLSLWLLVFLNKAMNLPYIETSAWLISPVNLVAIAAWSLVVIYHAALGVQVVIEDYVSTVPVRQLAIRASNLIFLILGVAALAALIIILTTN